MDREDTRGAFSPTQDDISDTELPLLPCVSSRFSYVGNNSEVSRDTEKAQENPRETHLSLNICASLNPGTKVLTSNVGAKER